VLLLSPLHATCQVIPTAREISGVILLFSERQKLRTFTMQESKMFFVYLVLLFYNNTKLVKQNTGSESWYTQQQTASRPHWYSHVLLKFWASYCHKNSSSLAMHGLLSLSCNLTIFLVGNWTWITMSHLKRANFEFRTWLILETIRHAQCEALIP